MKASEILNNTLKMLGYSDADGNPELTSRIRNQAVVAVNLVYADLWKMFYQETFVPIKSLDEEIKLPVQATNECFMYGLAMHISRSENDGDQQQFYAMLYNSKRAGLTHFEKVKNVIPIAGDY